ncbi:MAG: tRNA CCA-pyrophosphorylase [Deltaproteobacteria bacterium]|nr:tRNA CCA-pyrophosphorylase [Deltaproteobacteria bacterium]
MIDPNDYLDAALLLHGHRCPAMPLGLRAGAAAMELLGVERSGGKTLEAILELGDGHCAHCFADGVQMITGCTFGKGNIRKLGYGKFGLTLVDRQTGRAVRVVPRAEAQLQSKQTPFFTEYRMKGISPTEVPQAVVQPLIDKVMAAPAEALLRFGEITAWEVVGGDETFGSFVCARCGDMVVDRYARVVNGHTVCIPCEAALHAPA